MTKEVTDEPFCALHHERLADLLQRQPEQFFTEFFRAVRQTVKADDLGQRLLPPHAERRYAEFPRQLLVVPFQNFVEDFTVNSDGIEQRAVDVENDVRYRPQLF